MGYCPYSRRCKPSAEYPILGCNKVIIGTSGFNTGLNILPYIRTLASVSLRLHLATVSETVSVGKGWSTPLRITDEEAH